MALNAFEEVRLDPKIEFGQVGGPEFMTQVTMTTGGYEQRQSNWATARARYRSSHALQSQSEFDMLLNFFYGMRGQLTGFRFRDWLDYCSDMVGIITNMVRFSGDNVVVGLPAGSVLTAQALGFGDGSTTDFQIIKTYPNPGAGDDYVRQIKKIVSLNSTTGADTTPGAADANAQVNVYLDGVLKTEGAGNDYTVNSITGVISFTSPPTGDAVVSADYLFDVPVRFASDLFQGSKDAFDVDNWEGIDLIELRVS